LAYLQWGNSTVTNNLPSDLFNSSDAGLSISQWNPSLQGDILEFFAYGATYNYRNISLSLGVIETLFSHEVGSLLDYHERFYFLESILANNQTALNSRYSLNENQSTILYDYIRNVVVNYSFDAIFIKKTPYEFLWGYDNEYIRNTVLLFFLIKFYFFL